jgi:hypothetical protein
VREKEREREMVDFVGFSTDSKNRQLGSFF